MVLSKRVALIPTEKEIETLPRLARLAFAVRCSQRVMPICDEITATLEYANVAVTVARAASLIFETATLDSPLTSQLRCIRRDFVRLKKLARQEKWTDDTPVPPNVFRPMWPEGVAPEWADNGQ